MQIFRYFLSFLTIDIEQLVFFLLQNTCTTEPVIKNTSLATPYIGLTKVGPNVWEWYDNFVFETVNQVPSHSFHIKTSLHW